MNVAVSNAGRRWLWVTFWILVVFLYAPLVILVVFSFNDREFVSFPWEGFTLRWYRTFVDNTEILDALRMSLWVAALTAVVTT
ncbi:MAG: ABC transporter permease, partial [Actinomycetota bacterium]